MKQRFRISFNDKKDQILITEYMLWEGRYIDMSEEKYLAEQLISVVDKDIQEVIDAIRTNNLFPPYELGLIISKKLVQFLKETDESINETFVDWEDIEEIPVEKEEADDEDLIEDELSDLTDDLTDEDMEEGFLEESNEIESIVPKSKAPVDDEDAKSE
ncbi:hypothetical protein MHK_000288 [Candidatus Magnetomorum sp. HK-1]|nr:hypothetical protein MHK_000288 [Candidatus Magnetomorum sp. HK-1]